MTMKGQILETNTMYSLKGTRPFTMTLQQQLSYPYLIMFNKPFQLNVIW